MRKIVLSVSRNSRVGLVRDAALASGGFGVAPVESLQGALQKLETLPFSAVVLGSEFSVEEKKQFMAAVEGRRRFRVISVRRRGEPSSGADIEIDGVEHYRVVGAIRRIAS
jgi:hypothetical protein